MTFMFSIYRQRRVGCRPETSPFYHGEKHRFSGLPKYEPLSFPSLRSAFFQAERERETDTR